MAECEVLKVPRASLERATNQRPGLALEVGTLFELTLVEYEERLAEIGRR